MPTVLKSFVAGFASTLVFHQGVFLVLNLLGVIARKPWVMDGVPPLGVPAILSLAFWGGLWGIALWWMIRGHKGTAQWGLALLLGAVLPTLVALLVVLPLKGGAFAAGGSITVWTIALLVNGAWGIGVVVFMKLIERVFK
ncbi:MAG TPA: hypothetical protein PKZ76_15505 [Xanthomonadaceae bacterium]|nr:hypothetical protein [Xanthomonadaceae bacterium]